jgi:hypothetical protein
MGDEQDFGPTIHDAIWDTGCGESEWDGDTRFSGAGVGSTGGLAIARPLGKKSTMRTTLWGMPSVWSAVAAISRRSKPRLTRRM